MHVNTIAMKIDIIFIIWPRGSMYTANKRGPRIEPRGAPQKRGACKEEHNREGPVRGIRDEPNQSHITDVSIVFQNTEYHQTYPFKCTKIKQKGRNVWKGK